MARQNSVYLMGYVSSVNQYKTEGKEPFTTAFITVIRGERAIGDNTMHAQWDAIPIITRAPDMLEVMDTWAENDIVEVKGALACRSIQKGAYCGNCGEANIYTTGTVVYVNPVYAYRREHLASEEECRRYVERHREVSNQAMIFGTLCTDPKLTTLKAGVLTAQFQLAVARKMRLKDDPSDVKVDYPWCRSYGENAVRDNERLHRSSEVYVDGFLQSRVVRRKCTCKCCGEEMKWRDRAMELVPYQLEYVADYYTDEEVKQLKMEKLREKAEQIKASSGLLSPTF